ncbi:hypothetical protein QCE49_28130 [Caballeronia sp. LZ008]|uniref:hypothetical protein n=1 Tax=unclassified Caballeronia TaxID=2646786 RepID=UPI002028CB25|nr:MULTISPECIES: hypothetical protein [unclassified Caballeronia]MDR5797270.1 hypothetical protein [Caballeronia sp. LZ008]
MPRKIEQRAEGVAFDCVVPDNITEIYADGASEIQFGMPMSRILFHSVAKPGDGKTPEERVARLALVLPTSALLELVANIATNTTPEVAESTNSAMAGFIGHVSTQMGRLVDITAAKKK